MHMCMVTIISVVVKKTKKVKHLLQETQDSEGNLSLQT